MAEQLGEPAASEAEPSAGSANPDGATGGVAGDRGDWRDGLPAELAKAAGKFASPADVLKSYVALERRLGRAVVLPRADASPEELKQFNRRLGVPDGPEGYRIDVPGWLVDEASDGGGQPVLQQRFLAAMHAAGARPAEVTAAVDWYVREVEGMRQERMAAERRLREKAESELRREWGSDFDRNIALARRAFGRFGEEGGGNLDSLTLGDGQTLGDHPGFLRLLARVGSAVAEDQALVGDAAASTHDLYARIDALHALSPSAYKSAPVQAELGSLYRELHESDAKVGGGPE